MAKYFSNDSNAPLPERVHVGAVLGIFHKEQVLFDLRLDGGWGLIGGALEIGESLVDCAKREALEETGLEITDVELIGVFSQPDRIICRHGETVQLLTTCFAASVTEPKLKISEESRELRFFSKGELDSVEVVPTHQVIVPYLFDRDRWPTMA